MPVVDTKFELCQNVETVLKIGRDYQNKDGYRGAHFDTVKLLCDTIEYLRDKLPKPDPDWKAICKKCHDGEIEPKCEYYGEPNGCNSPIYGEHPTVGKTAAWKRKHHFADVSKMGGNAAAMREAVEAALTTIRGIISGTIARTNNSVFDCRDKLKSALALPPRNCDVGSAEEQAKRYDKFCEGMYCVKCPVHALWHHYFEICKNQKVSCGLIWAQMPYGAEEGGAE